jgi:hypothetical protein
MAKQQKTWVFSLPQPPAPPSGMSGRSGSVVPSFTYTCAPAANRAGKLRV